jgi:hypothetical protein
VYIAPRAICLVLLLVAAGCASSTTSKPSRPFSFQTDTFSYSNQLVWEYRLDPATGKTVTNKREPPPTYAHHCFVVVRAARQFFDHARFDATLPRATNYTQIVRKVLDRSPRKPSADDERIVIPGYANLRDFSSDHALLLQRECGSAWQSYFQRGHWRMLFPLTRRHQHRTANELLTDLQQNRPQIVHIVRFPSLAINHALLVYGAERSEGQTRFLAYDPNNADSAATLTFSENEKRFTLPGNLYFPRGGRVDVYPIFTGLLY